MNKALTREVYLDNVRMSLSTRLVERLRAFAWRRQGLGHSGSDALAALERVVGTYSSHPTAPLSLWARARGMGDLDYPSLDARRAVVRLPAMRQSVFLLPSHTVRRVFSATRVPLERLEPRLRYAGLDWDGYGRIREQVREQTREPRTADELQAALGLGRPLMTAIRLMACDGEVLRLSLGLRSDSWRYVWAESWLGVPIGGEDPVASLAWLAGAYLRGYGPARAQDFAWWAGVPKGKAAAAVARTETVDVGGGHLLPVDLHSEFAEVEPVPDDSIDLLPKWDALTMGYAPDGRQRLVEGPWLSRAYTQKGEAGATAGDGLPLVCRGGRAVGTWSHRCEGDRMRVEARPFTGDFPAAAILEEALRPAAHLLSASAVEVRVVRDP